MGWKVKFHQHAEKEFKKLGKNVQKDIYEYLNNRVLKSSDPRDLGKPLRKDKFGLWRYRVGDHRIIVQLEKQELTILVIRVAKRDQVYK